jgi:hypothetical protein
MPKRYFRRSALSGFLYSNRSIPDGPNRTQGVITMSLIKSAVLAGGMTLALATGALAQGTGFQPWDLQERQAYVIMMDGTMKSMRVGDKGYGSLMKAAKRVPRGTVFLMSNGNLYMVNAKKMFDFAGMPSFGGGY